MQVDVTDFVALVGNAAYYHRPNGAPGYPNIDEAVFDQFIAEAAQGAVDQGFDLDDYTVMVVLRLCPNSTRLVRPGASRTSRSTAPGWRSTSSQPSRSA